MSRLHINFLNIKSDLEQLGQELSLWTVECPSSYHLVRPACFAFFLRMVMKEGIGGSKEM